MARYKEYCYEQTKLIPLSFSRQILPGTFEYTLNYLIDNEFDLSVFEQRYHNDETGAPAYDPAILLKIILYGYVRGLQRVERSSSAVKRILFSWRCRQTRIRTLRRSQILYRLAVNRS